MSESASTYYNIMKKKLHEQTKKTIYKDEACDIDALFCQNNSIENSEEESLVIAIRNSINLDDYIKCQKISDENQSQYGIADETRDLISGEKELEAQNELNSDHILSIDNKINIENAAILNLRPQA